MENCVCFITKYSTRRKKPKGEPMTGHLLYSDPIKYCKECQNNTCSRHYMIGNKHYRCEEELFY